MVTRTVAIAFGSVGSGHRIAAQAIGEELARLTDGSIAVELLDILDFAAIRVSGDTAATSFTGPTAPLYDRLWSSAAFAPSERKIAPLAQPFFRGFLKRVATLDPVAVVCTHAMPCMLAARARRRKLVRWPVIGVGTDMLPHGMWPLEGVDAYCVASERGRTTFAERGFDPAAVYVTGVPLRTGFAAGQSRDAAREHFGMTGNRPVVTIIAGAGAPGPYAQLALRVPDVVDELSSTTDATILVVCGRDAELRDALTARVASRALERVIVLGFVDDMAQLMAASDLIVCKPGGATTAECLATGVPMVLVGPAFGQERANVEALVGENAAHFATTPEYVVAVAAQLLADPTALSVARSACNRLARPHAAEDVAHLVLDLIGRTDTP